MPTFNPLGSSASHLFFDRHPHAALLLDDSGRVLHANAAAHWLASRGEYPDFATLTGLSWSDDGTLPRDLAEGWTRRLRVTAADGSSRQAEVTLLSATEAQEALPTFFLLLRDLTASVEAARGNHELESRAKVTTESAPVLIWMAADDMFRDWFSKSWLRFRGRSFGDEVGEGWTEGVHPEDLERCLAIYSSSFEERQPFTMDYRLRRHDGVYRWVLDTGIPRWGENGSFSGYIGTCVDITDRKEMEDKLAEHTRSLRLSDRRREDFLTRLSHELRNPLGAIANAAAILRTVEHGDRNLMLVREIVERQVGQISGLLSDLVNVTRITKGKVLVQRARIDVAALLAQAVEKVQVQTQRRSQSVRINSPADPIVGEGDAQHLLTALTALLGNASKFSPEAASIEVATIVTSDAISISIKDPGSGMAPDFLPHACELFVQGSQSDFGSGLGVGLTIAQHVARLHGGELRLASAGIGLGTEATLTIPRHAQPSEDLETVADLSSISGCRILIIEDNADVRESLRALVELQGNEVVTAGDGAQALEIAGSFCPDLVICDIGLPDGDGFGLVRTLRETLAGLPTRYLAVTGYGRPEDFERARQAGFDSFVVKPGRPPSGDAAIPRSPETVQAAL